MNVSKITLPKITNDIDGCVQRLAAIEAIAVMMSVGYAEKTLGTINHNVVAAAWDGIALLADDASKVLHDIN